MEICLQLTWNSLVFGLLSASLAASFSQIYAVSRVLHLVHGAVAVFGSYVYFSLSSRGLGFFPSFLLAMIAAGLLGILVNELVYEPMRRRRRIAGAAFMIVSLGGLMLLQNFMLAVWSSKTLRIESPLDNLPTTTFGGVIFTPTAIAIVFASLLFFVGLGVVMRKTRFGMAARAVADHEEMAEIVGINTRRVRQSVFLLHSMLAGGFGVLASIAFALEPSKATLYAIDAFAVSLTGGLGSLPGALIAGVGIQLTSNMSGFWFPAIFQNAFVFVAIFIFLLLRPQGLFGSKKT
jgi:branched-chain amino acid transport system permease protein